MFNKYNKNIILNKSIYAISDKIRLEGYINRINKNTHDIEVIENDKQYKILVTNKIERA
tara:strand:+ start:780 stop:956 length:177 start_codon:yes stop_codon:yes gene_type:complete